MVDIILKWLLALGTICYDKIGHQELKNYVSIMLLLRPRAIAFSASLGSLSSFRVVLKIKFFLSRSWGVGVAGCRIFDFTGHEQAPLVRLRPSFFINLKERQ